MDIDGNLWAKVNLKIKVPVKIQGNFTIEYKDHVIDELNDTTIRVCSVFYYQLSGEIFDVRCSRTLSWSSNPPLWRKHWKYLKMSPKILVTGRMNTNIPVRCTHSSYQSKWWVWPAWLDKSYFSIREGVKVEKSFNRIVSLAYKPGGFDIFICSIARSHLLQFMP